MKISKLKIINKKKPSTGVIYSKLILMDPVPAVGNFNLESLNKPIKVSQNYFMTFTEYYEKEKRRKHYYNKIKN